MKKCLAVLIALVMLSVSCVPAMAEVYTLTREDHMYFSFTDQKRIIGNYEYYFREKSLGICIDNYNAAFDALKASHPEVKTYLYYVESSRTLDLGISYDKEKYSFVISNDFVPVSPSYDIIKENLHVDECSHLEINSLDDLMNYFYSTDHHWNYKGSYKAYTDVARMLLGEDEKLVEPVEEYVFPFVFNGSNAKNLKLNISDEKFTVYLYDLPEYTTFVNEHKRAMNNSEYYMNGKLKAENFTNHYGLYYGGDYGSVRLENPDAAHGSLLIIGSSYATPLKPLLANHYKSVMSVDPRHYEEAFERKLRLSELVEEYNIDDVLILCGPDLLIDINNPIWK